MFGTSYASRKFSYFQYLIGYNWVCQGSVSLSVSVNLSKPVDHFPVFFFQSLRISLFHGRNLRVQFVESVERFIQVVARDVRTQRVYAYIVYVVSFVKHHDGVLVEVFGNYAGDLRVQKVMVAVNDDVGVDERLSGHEIRAQPLFCAQLLEVVDVVNVGRQYSVPAERVELLVETAHVHFLALGVPGAHKRGRHRVTPGVNDAPVVLACYRRVNAQVLAGGQHDAQDVGVALVRLVVVAQHAQLLGSLFDLRQRSGAIQELGQFGRVLDHVGDNQRQDGDGLAGARRHLQQAVSLGVQPLLQLHHVRVLFRVYVLVGEQHFQLVDKEPHFRRSGADTVHENHHKRARFGSRTKIRTMERQFSKLLIAVTSYV